MRILKIVPQAFYCSRGTPLSAYHRARELIALGHEVDILTYAVGSEPPALAARVYRARGAHFRRSIGPGPSRLKIWFDLLLFINLLTRLCRQRYDLLYAHEEGALLARLAGAIFGIPYVYDMHSSLPLQISDWKFSNSRWVIGTFRAVERLCVRGACAVVAISPAVAAAARQACSVTPCVTIVNQLETEQTPAAEEITAVRERHQISPERKIVLYTGSFVALQALDMLLDAVPRVVASVPEAVFLLVGGSEEEIAVLRAQAQRLGVSDFVLFESARPQAMIPAYLLAAQVLVSPRTQGINPPGKLLPYLASGRVVVATDTLVHNQILSRECAILTPPSAEGLAEGLITALTDPARVAGLTAEALKLCRRHGDRAARDAAYAQVLGAAEAANAARSCAAGRLLPRRRRA